VAKRKITFIAPAAKSTAVVQPLDLSSVWSDGMITGYSYLCVSVRVYFISP